MNHIPTAYVGVSIRLVGVRVGSTRLFRYQHVRIGNAKSRVGGPDQREAIMRMGSHSG